MVKINEGLGGCIFHYAILTWVRSDLIILSHIISNNSKLLVALPYFYPMATTEHKYYIIYKPYNMVSQFVSPDDVRLLGDLNFDFPEGTHAIGRLDSLSEGLLILTTNKAVTKLLFQGPVPHQRTYLVKVKGYVSQESLEQLNSGVSIRTGLDEYHTTACDVAKIVEKPDFIENLPNEWHQGIPHTWLTITLFEGKFHQVRKMVAAINHPCKRLIRLSIEDMQLFPMVPSEVKELEEQQFFNLLRISYP